MTSLALSAGLVIGSVASTGCARMSVGPTVVAAVAEGAEARSVPTASNEGNVSQDGLGLPIGMISSGDS
jgi:hypothetical protein